MAYTELTVWTRGIIMDKEGRDIVNSISASARIEGKYAQAMENYVDNPDRTNCPTRKYCRVSDQVLENELTYENEHPNIVVLVEGTMVKGWDYMRGMPPGGTLVINHDGGRTMRIRIQVTLSDGSTIDDVLGWRFSYHREVDDPFSKVGQRIGTPALLQLPPPGYDLTGKQNAATVFAVKHTDSQGFTDLEDCPAPYIPAQ